MALLYGLPAIAAFAYYLLTGRHSLTDDVNIFHVWFFATLLATSWAVWRGGDKPRQEALGVLWLIWAVWWVNDLADLPEHTAAFANLAVGLYFIAVAQERWQLICGLCFPAMTLGVAAAELGAIPGYGECGPRFLDVCGPDIAFLLGLVACYALGFSADDMGRVRHHGVWHWLGRPSPVGIIYRRLRG